MTISKAIQTLTSLIWTMMSNSYCQECQGTCQHLKKDEKSKSSKTLTVVQHEKIVHCFHLDMSKDRSIHLGNFFGSKPDVLNVRHLFFEHLRSLELDKTCDVKSHYLVTKRDVTEKNLGLEKKKREEV